MCHILSGTDKQRIGVRTLSGYFKHIKMIDEDVLVNNKYLLKTWNDSSGNLYGVVAYQKGTVRLSQKFGCS
jgi:hypothetical protein